MSVRRGAALEGFGFGMAEFASMGVSLGVVGVADKLIPKEIMHAVVGTVAKVCIEPFLDPIEKTLTWGCKLEECQPDKTKSRQERAEAIAKWVVVGGAAWYISLQAKGWARHEANKMLHVPDEERKVLAASAPALEKLVHKITLSNWTRQEKMIMLSDELAHYGSLIYMNNKGAKFTDDHIRSTQGLLEKIGFGKKTAHDMATWVWVWEAPNVVGMLAGMGAVAGKHAFGWPGKHQYQTMANVVSGQAHSLAGGVVHT